MNTPNRNEKPIDNMELLKQQAAGCGPGCGCNATGKPSKKRWVIGAIVLAAAGVMVVRAALKNDGASNQAAAPAFTDPVAVATNSNATVSAPETMVGTTLGAFSELNTVAIKTDAVFIYLPAKESGSVTALAATMNRAANTIESNAGKKCGLFTLKPDSPDYARVAAQVSLPAVLAIVKGRGMSGISGDITETKLVQGYLAASSASACGSSAGASCCPK
jgi:hypothetical protein